VAVVDIVDKQTEERNGEHGSDNQEECVA